ncbi:MAG: nuclear transport factor 2 family protein [Terriglobia bacterium]
MKLARLALVAVLAVSLNAAAQVAGKKSNEAVSRAALEQQLWKLDQQWLDAVQNRKMAFLNQMWTTHFIEILPGGRVVTKADQMERLAKTRRKPGTGSTRDDFKLRAVYGNVALATDHMTQKGTKVYGRDITGDYRVTRVFVKEDGKWRVAESALVPIGFHSSTAASHEASKESKAAASYTGLEKELWEIDQKWEEAARNHDLDFLKKAWTSQLFIVLPGGRVVDKPELLAVVAKAPRGPNIGPFPDDFKLRAVYGNFAIATDRTVIKGAALPNPHASGAYRIVKFFVKQNGKWRVAGAADVAIAPK